MKYIQMKKAASLNSRGCEASMVSFVFIVDSRNIIGRQTSGYMNVKNTVFAPPCGVELLFMVQNCHSDIGLSPYTCLHRPREVYQLKKSSNNYFTSGINRFWVCYINCARPWKKGTNRKYQLSGSIELDEGFISTEIPEQEKDKPLKRGRGSQKKTKVLVMAESKAIEGETKKNGKPRKVRFIKMQLITDLKGDTITLVVKKDVSVDSELITDDSTSYLKLKDVVDKHDAQVIPIEKIGSVLPWVYIAISNAKRMLLDIHHDIKREHLQNYLNEFCYNFNRRYFGEALFDRLLVASIAHKNQIFIF